MWDGHSLRRARGEFVEHGHLVVALALRCVCGIRRERLAEYADFLEFSFRNSRE